MKVNTECFRVQARSYRTLTGKTQEDPAKVLCCKNSSPKATGVEDCILLSLGGHSKQGGDECHLTPDVSFLHALYLPLPHHMHRFISL